MKRYNPAISTKSETSRGLITEAFMHEEVDGEYVKYSDISQCHLDAHFEIVRTRRSELVNAIFRYKEAGIKIPKRWVEELGELI